MKDKKLYSILIESYERLSELIETSQYEQAYDLVDCLHCLPNVIVHNNFLIPKSYWKTYVNFYRKKWDKKFLQNLK